MIRSFKNKALRQFFETGKSAKVNPDLRKRVRIILDTLHAAQRPTDMSGAGHRLHERQGADKGIFSVDVNGPWRILFRWGPNGPFDVDLVQDH